MTDAMSLLIGFLVMLATPAYFLLQIWAPLKLARGWRTAALAPLVPAIPLLIWCAYALADNSNLWPVPFILFAPFGAGYLGLILAIGRKES